MEIFRVEFFVEDKNLGRAKRALAGIAMDLKDTPAVNTKKTANGVSPQVTNGDLVKLFAEFLFKKLKLQTISAAHAKGFLKSIGRSDNGYPYLLKKSTEYGLLVKAGTGPATKYKVQKTAKTPKKGAKK